MENAGSLHVLLELCNTDPGTAWNLDTPGSPKIRETSAEDILVEVLENNVSDPTNYITSLMPSRQAQLIGYRYSTLRQKSERLRRLNSHHSTCTRDSVQSTIDALDFATPSPASFDLLEVSGIVCT